MVALAGDVRSSSTTTSRQVRSVENTRTIRKQRLTIRPDCYAYAAIAKSLSYNKGIALHTHSLITALYPKPEIKTPGKAGRYVIKPCPVCAARPPAEAHLHGMLPA
jgi:hypothetical protein